MNRPDGSEESVHGPGEAETRVTHLGLVDSIELLVQFRSKVFPPVPHNTWQSKGRWHELDRERRHQEYTTSQPLRV